MSKKRLVMIGNGMAGIRTIEEILKLGPEMFEITIFGSEPHPNYNRIQLSTVLQGDAEVSDIILNDWNWYEENKITLYTGETIVKVDTKNQRVISNEGRITPYDELIFATGSSSLMLPLPGVDKKGVTGFRDIQDTETMMEAARQYKKAVVIGGGLLGLEAARGLLNLGMKVDVVHLVGHLMERQLDPIAGEMLKQELENQGMNFLLEKKTTEIFGDERVRGLRFTDGTEVEADLVVMAIGIVPNALLASESGVRVNRGIVVNDLMQTSIPHVYAVGECAEHREVTYGLVAPLYEQAKVLAEKVCHRKVLPYEGSVTGAQLKVAGVDLFSAGEITEDATSTVIRFHNEYAGVYKKVILRDNQIVGIVMYGDTKESTRLFRLMTLKEDISNLTDMELLQPIGAEGTHSINDMPDDEMVCGCNGVSKGDIVSAIHEHSLHSVEEVKGCTNAGRSCGRCKPIIADILEHTLGEEFDSSEQKVAMCGCTPLSHDEVVDEIKEKGLTTIKETMNVLAWQNEEGCTKCRPALNYYLGMVHPEYKDDRNSRLVNEKMHANIQKDGTYSVVPRMYGGVTTAQDLIRIGQVAEKYHIPLVKMTGGQRIALMGVKKEDLTAVWKELDMPSGYAYGKTLRTVKTCVGSTFCRFGTQDSMGLGQELERMFERLDTPHKVKMSVSACPRNCSESGIKDVGVVGIDGGWEIYVGGNGGTDLRAGDLLYTVKTKEELLEITRAFLQYYRETGHYLERTSKWVERFGLDHIKEVLENEAKRVELNARLSRTLERYEEPWSKILEDDTAQNNYYGKREVLTT
ncbi:nitrite reductase large subunit NirB [Pontibacillus yanchengensis]|uniref:Nitrite reductase n=1 Tax=Pontibacillus yanchengensis Y32 TaxID=1385514 RepID=A0A0A2TH76_9BACI|nr:nitrite reductase large subunit NirB [Pontibacillus yanchengensis]KGP73426.1 nitrite reductase [Pontibacillus yanchengensis Y32]